MVRKHFTMELSENNIAVVTFNNNNREMNVLEKEALEEMNGLIDDFSDNDEVKGVIFISGKKDQFVVGADIEEISAFRTTEEATDGASKMQRIFDKISRLKCPTVAAIHGPCLGGGLEMSLACDWRVITNSKYTKLALPEIQLGLIPGAGGTQRLPRTIGIQSALDMILTGKNINPEKAKKIGLVNAVVPETQILKQAFIFAAKKRNTLEITNKKSLTANISKIALEGNLIGRKIVYRKAKEAIDSKTKGFYPASYKALDAIFDGFEMSLQKGLKLEAKFFGELAMTKESQALIHLFKSTNHIKKHPFKTADKNKFGGSATKLVGIVGAGFMGSGIANICVDKGIKTRIADPSEKSISKALQSANKYFSKKVRRKKLKPFELKSKLAAISPGLDNTGLHTTDVTIEAVYEDLDLKKQILSSLESKANESWIFATNTSAIPVSKIAENASNPERVVGMHFFSPVEKMPLLEVIKTKESADWAVGRVVKLGQSLGKQVIIVNDGPGFYTTRALAFFLAEAISIIREGTDIKLVDKAMTEFGFPVGPATLIDEVGIDVGVHVLKTMAEAFPERIGLDSKIVEIVNEGYVGRKVGKGLYNYSNDGKKLDVNQKIYRKLGVNPSKSQNNVTEIIDRILFIFINESIRCLEDGVINNPHDGDVGAVFGLGFPPFWGGPFKYVDLVGANTVITTLNELSKKYGARFKPTKTLLDYAKNGSRFFADEP